MSCFLYIENTLQPVVICRLHCKAKVLITSHGDRLKVSRTARKAKYGNAEVNSYKVAVTPIIVSENGDTDLIF